MKDAFKEKLNDIKAPDALVQNTLEKMLEENSIALAEEGVEESPNNVTRLSDARRKKEGWARASKIWLPVAACICLAVVGAQMLRRPGSIYWADLQFSQIPHIDAPLRGDEEEALDFPEYEKAIGLRTDALVEGYAREATEVHYVALPQTGESGYCAEIAFAGKDGAWMLSIYPFSYPMEVVIQQHVPPAEVKNTPVYFAFDKEEDCRAGVWQAGELHFEVEAKGFSAIGFKNIVEQAVAAVQNQLK